MNYKELLFNKDKVLSFYPELAVILNKYDEILAEEEFKNGKTNKGGNKRRAGTLGLNEAIIINQINYWNEINKKTGRNLKDGYYWTYNTYDGWAKNDFPYWSADTIRKSISALENMGIIISTDKYNSYKIDNTKWYRVDCDKLQKIIDIVEESENQVPQVERVSCSFVNESCDCVNESYTDGLGNIHKPIPEITTENTTRDYTDNSLSSERASESESPQIKKQNRKKEANELFERVWKLYPKKIGKGQVSDTQKLRLLDIGYDELERAIQRCCEYNKDKDKQYWQNGSTFFNSGYIDFLDENYQDCNSFDGTGVKEIQKEPLSEKEKIRLGMEKARQEFGDRFGEKYWEGMDDGKKIVMLQYLGIHVDEF